MVTKLITEFIDKFCIRVADDEDPATTDLYMDNHFCINFKDEFYYLPENISTMDEEESLLYMLILNSFEI